MNILRLNYMKEALEAASILNVSVNMDKWATVPLIAIENFDELGPITMEAAHACGTACCIAGWAGTHPRLQEDGLSLDTSGEYGLTLYLMNNSFVEIYGTLSLATFFDINKVQAVALFSNMIEGFDSLRDLSLVYSDGLFDAVEAWSYRGGIKYATVESAIKLIDKILAEGAE